MLYVVGIGPGSINHMSGEALSTINKCEVIAGYTVYIDLIKDLIINKQVITSVMKQEVDRVRLALHEAINKDVALVCSGDAGIYGLASLCFEVNASENLNVHIEVIPGITAASSAAAILGAPLTHDCALISLSDLLTPLEDIYKRIDYASKAGFVLVIYNPTSKKRATYLKKACHIIMANIGQDINCGYVKNINRNNQESHILKIAELADTQLDMFTTIIIGNKNTKVINNKLVTPRGYQF